MKSRDVKVENIFGAKADFIVELVHQRIQPEVVEDPKKKKKKPPTKVKSPRDLAVKEDQNGEIYLAPFSTKITTLSIAKGGTSVLPVQFLPFTLETHTCYIIFRDDKVGEMQYTLTRKNRFPSRY